MMKHIEGQGWTIWADDTGAMVQLQPACTQGVDLDAPWDVWLSAVSRASHPQARGRALKLHIGWDSKHGPECVVTITGAMLYVETLPREALPGLPVRTPRCCVALELTDQLRDALQHAHATLADARQIVA